MRFELTERLLEQAERFHLRSACRHCFHYVGEHCAHEWPGSEQKRWPLDAPGPGGVSPTTVDFCKEFELR